MRPQSGSLALSAKYLLLLKNSVLVQKKNNNEWRMCVDYTDPNKLCPKDPFGENKPAIRSRVMILFFMILVL